MQFIRATHSGNDKALALWDFNNYNGHLSGAWGLISKARQSLEGFWSIASTIEADERRSESAKRDDTRAQRIQRASEVGKLQRELNAQRQQLNAARQKLSAVPEYTAETGAAVALLDIEIAKRVAGMEPAKRATLVQFGGDQRLVDALLRVPAIISGLTPEQLSNLTKIAVARRHPEQAQQIAEQSLALDRAAEGLQRAFAELGDGLNLDEKVAAAQGEPALIRHHSCEVIDGIHARQQREGDADAGT